MQELFSISKKAKEFGLAHEISTLQILMEENVTYIGGIFYDLCQKCTWRLLHANQTL